MKALSGPRPACLLMAGALAIATCGVAGAQILPVDPIVFANGAVTLGGDVSASVGSDDPGFYNYTDYQYSSFRRVRAALAAAVKTGSHVTLLGELQLQNGNPEASAFYVRLRPWTSRAFDIQVGRIPPVFGAFARRTYTSENPLVGYPLGYQYLTSLRPDAVPANADELLRMRGRGWLSQFSVGNLEADHGVPMVSIFRWDTGIQVQARSDTVDFAAAVTLGTLSNPLVKEDNEGRQFAGRLAFHPVPGLVVGASAASGPFLATSAVRAATTEDPSMFTQRAGGVDAEYSRGHFVVRAETIVSRWTLPPVSAPFIDEPLLASVVSVEGRYKIRPGLYAAARGEHLGFSTITGSSGRRTWEAPVTRLETGAGWLLQRNLLLKLSYQFNKRDTTRQPRSHLIGTEVVFWL